ncbi:unnamed protein product [Tilletia controversa]|uniref:Uncharacterized protein n=3 Tax=Tilletia TaxID=13289 RepID=A0A8X7MUX5_9BASI|nr:hypothetical protein CF336_g3375 [Tilletia laevis]KAE8199866.1 hypothetical protein CF328_g3124 [Tilletia controversa]KAE8262072.1 hypothetical protein A4X03_0g2748 [Tilletia caries]KAE8204503.1 hypothetical protein CF335_g2635 [Tilletia laevis]KAE8248261.1 hypothetical protein A4X06_0g3841 [Tilletia controversa]
MSSNDEQTFTIQPHPAKTNDPSDPANTGSGAQPSAAQQAAAHVTGNNPGPHIPANVSSLEEPLSKDELAARSAELNK